MTIPDSQRPKRVALVVHPHRDKAGELAHIVERWWSERGVEVLLDFNDPGPESALFQRDIDVVISFGGDGTMLRTVALAAPAEIPVLGVNLGNLGYLTTVEPEDITRACELLMGGDYGIEERMMIDVTVTSSTHPSDAFTTVAMNEVVVEKTADGHTIHLGVKIGDDQFLTYVADGMMVATPTGSTAYNLSLRGPIVSPRLRALVMTPIAPHMLFDRTLVIEPELAVCFTLLGDRDGVAVIDGERVAQLIPGDQIDVCESKNSARIVKFGERDFYRILHSKFGLLDR